MKLKVNEELKQHFRPEFLNRLDDVIVFHQLTRPEILQIVELMITSLDERLKDKDMGLILTDQAKELLVDKGYDQSLGARPMRRTIQREIEDVLSEKILFGELTAGNLVVVGVEGEAANPDKKTSDTRVFTFTGEAKQPLPDAPPVNSAAE
jgi:ATP-dependent Clp protease ATP-binding subunit ClpC